MSNKHGVSIIHRVPGRVRLGVEALRKDPTRAEQVAAMARACRWVTDARANPWAASLAVHYELGVPVQDVFASLARIPELAACGAGRLEDLPRPRRAPAAPPDPKRPAAAVVKTAARVNAASTSLVSPHVDLRILIPGALVGVGVLSLLRGPGVLPHWVTLLKYGFDTFAVFNQGIIKSFLEETPSDEGESRVS